MAAEINAQLETGAPSLLGFEPVTIADLRQRWLDHHEHIRRSSVNTIKRYRAATMHLVNFVEAACRVRLASDFRARQAEEFVKYLAYRTYAKGLKKADTEAHLDLNGGGSAITSAALPIHGGTQNRDDTFSQKSLRATAGTLKAAILFSPMRYPFPGRSSGRSQS